MPRVLFELGAEAPHLGSEAGLRVVELLAAEVQRVKLDGLVLEVSLSKLPAGCGLDCAWPECVIKSVRAVRVLVAASSLDVRMMAVICEMLNPTYCSIIFHLPAICLFSM